MVAISGILLPERAGERCGDDIGVSMGNRGRHRNPRNRRRPAALNRWLTRDPIGYQGGIDRPCNKR
jgi:hypothetical protein